MEERFSGGREKSALLRSGLLRYSLYGTRDAAQNWEEELIGGRSAVEFLIRMISKKCEIKKQVIGEDPDFEMTGRILNRVNEWNRDGITTEADERHERQIMKGLELERANHSATSCAVERRDECKGYSRHGQGQTQTEHEWDNANNSEDRDRPQMAGDDNPDRQALTNGDIRRYRALVARISYFSQDRPHLKFASVR